MRDRDYRRRSRAFNARAAECGIELPRDAGRRRAFMQAYREAFSRSQLAALRDWRPRWSRGSLRALGPVTGTVVFEWEGRLVSVEATFDMSRGGMTVQTIASSG